MWRNIPNQKRARWEINEDLPRRVNLVPRLYCSVYGVDDALLAVSIAATAAGTGAQMSAQSKARSATDRAARAELLRQQEYQKRAADVAAQSAAGSTRAVADEQLQTGANDRVAAYQRIIAPAGGEAPAVAAPRAVTTPTTTANTQNTALVQAWNRILGGAQARLGAYQDWGLNQGIKNQRAAQELGMIGSDARGSAGVLNAELENASHAGDGLMTLGKLLGTGGNLIGTYRATTPRVVR